jgi:hypothetical protein
MSTPTKPLFHYTTAGLLILDNLKLKSTPPIEFNDPFEFCPRVDESKPLKKQFFKRNKREFLEMHYADYKVRGGKLGFKEFRKSEREQIKVQAKELVKDSRGLKAKHRDAYAVQAGRTIGVTCFSEKYNNILMWSHYADEHKGMVLGFNPSSQLMQKNKLFRVDYRSERVEIDPSEEVRYVEAVLKRKSEDWEYEAEWRLLRLRRYCEEKRVGKNILRLFPIEPSDISRVYVGCRNTQLDAINTIRRKPQFSHIEWYRMEMHPDKFELVEKRL